MRNRLLLLAFLLIGTTALAEPARVALVIGNAAYSRAALANPINDARAMTQALQAAGFHVTTLENADRKSMKQAVNAFAEQLQAGSIALFYYSGHGVQHNGANYLIPIGALENLENAAQLEYEALDSGYILGVMEASGSSLNLFILDACRNNPFSGQTRSSDAQGLAYMNGSQGTLIAYATAPGTVAYDGAGVNSPYTAALVKWMRQPLPIEQLLKNVLNEVRAATHGKQNPWYAASISNDFYFTTPTMTAGEAPASPSPDDHWLTRLNAWADAHDISAEILPREREALLSLDILKLNRHGLRDLPPEIGQLRNLRVLDLSDNDLRELPAEIGNLLKLQRLEISNNQLTQLPESIGQLQQLQTLDLGDNQLSILSDRIRGLSQLQWLNLEHNPLAAPADFSERDRYTAAPEE